MNEYNKDEQKIKNARARCRICGFINIPRAERSAVYHHQQHMLKSHQNEYDLIDTDGKVIE